MMEFLFGYFLGRTAQGFNPFQMVLGYLLAFAIFGVLGATVWAVWEYSDAVSAVLFSLNILPQSWVDFLQPSAAPVDDNHILFMAETAKRMLVCLIAFTIALPFLLVASSLLGKATAIIVSLLRKAVRFSIAAIRV